MCGKDTEEVLTLSDLLFGQKLGSTDFHESNYDPEIFALTKIYSVGFRVLVLE